MNDERLDFEEYNELFNYDGEVGALTNKTRRSTRALVGRSSTAKGRGGKLIVRHKGQILDAARIAWLLSTGNDPGNDGVRCINGDLSDLKSLNLALVDSSDNAAIKEVAEKLETEEKQSQVEQEKQKQAREQAGQEDQEEKEALANGEVVQLPGKNRWSAKRMINSSIQALGVFPTRKLAIRAIMKACQ